MRKAVAKHLGTNHTEFFIDEKSMFDLVDSIPKYYDEPFADSSQIPSMLVAGLAARMSQSCSLATEEMNFSVDIIFMKTWLRHRCWIFLTM